MNRNELVKELSDNIKAIWSNKKYKSERKKVWRTVEIWKQIINRYMEQETDVYTKLLLESFHNGLTYKIYEIDPEIAKHYIFRLLNSLKKGD